MKLVFSRESLFLLVVFVAGEIMGNLLGFHTTLPQYDVFMHFVGGALVSSVIINLLLERLEQYSYITNVFVTLGIGALFEIFEFCADVFFKTTTQPGLEDTMIDLIIVLAAAIIINTIYWFRHIREK
ncbi:MAG TPA: DUF2238 domain-containing protein [archaeon]|nr:DUF2238 domain-containing protein [archaeon]